MEIQKCYYASFNVGNVEVWGTELYLDKESVFIEVEISKDEIVESIDSYSYLDQEIIIEILEYAILGLKKYDFFQDKKYDLDFFIMEKSIWKNYQQKIEYKNGDN